MNKFVGLLTLSFWISLVCYSQKDASGNRYTVVSYNIENLFDTTNDPKIQDEDFLPESDKKWTVERYKKKLNDLATVISEINPLDFSELVGLVEVENRQVLIDLVNTPLLKKQDYGIVHEESPDLRGIDVALIYRRDAFKELRHEAIPVTIDGDSRFKTRDILYVVGLVKKRTIHVFVNHWPSRVGGDEKTEPKRIRAASVLKARIDLIFKSDPKACIIIMGDMNDEPTNTSLSKTLDAQSPESGAKLVNLMIPADQKGLGTYFYSGNWNMLDNLVVSNAMIGGNQIKVMSKKGFIYQNKWMVYKHKNGNTTPNRTYVGDKYAGGVSDHFPVYFKMMVK